MQANIVPAIALCREIEKFSPNYGCHVALTGGCLHKDGARKDIDILFYRIRQEPSIDIEGLKKALEIKLGFSEIKGFGWILKGIWSGYNIDMFFPEEIEGEEYNSENSNG